MTRERLARRQFLGKSMAGVGAYRSGRSVSWDVDTERSDPEVAHLLTRPYRAPWKLG